MRDLGFPEYFWLVDEIVDGGGIVETASDGSSRRLPNRGAGEEPIGFQEVLVRPSIMPMADDPGGGSGYNCVEYCRLSQRTYAVYEYSNWIQVVKYVGPAACALLGGSSVWLGAGLGYACYVMVEEIWTEKKLIGIQCVDWSWACSDNPNQAPKVPKTKYLPNVYVPGN